MYDSWEYHAASKAVFLGRIQVCFRSSTLNFEDDRILAYMDIDSRFQLSVQTIRANALDVNLRNDAMEIAEEYVALRSRRVRNHRPCWYP